MNLKITLLLFFIGFILNAQKQLQPYNFSITDEGKTETILIYATAEAINSITFTLKNTKNEVLKDITNKDLTFKVFPFTEVSFRNNLSDVIMKLVDTDSTKFNLIKAKVKPLEKKELSENSQKTLVENPNAIGLEKENKKLIEENKKLKTRKEAVYSIRNIYQFFNALVITAFEYDTEPVAGLLKYNLNELIVYKKTIQGLNTDLYFKTKAKFIRKQIIQEPKKLATLRDSYKKVGKNRFTKDTFFLKVGKNKFIDLTRYVLEESDPFLVQLRKDRKILKELYEFNRNSQKGLWNKARPTFKKYSIQKLKEYYNDYELEKLNEEVIKEFCGIKKSISTCSIEIKNLSSKVNSIQLLIDDPKRTQTNDSLARVIIKNLNDQKNQPIELNSELKSKQIKLKELKELKDFYSKELINVVSDSISPETLSSLVRKIDSLNTKYFNFNLKFNNEYQELKNKKTKKIEKLIKSTEQNFNKKNSAKELNKEINIHNEELERFQKELSKLEESLNALVIENKNLIRQFPMWLIKAKEIELDINDGFIEHLKVVGNILKPYYNEETDSGIKDFFKNEKVQEVLSDIFGKTLKFENDFPFGFSSKSDFADLYNYNLYQSEGQEKIFSLPVTNVITYIQRHQNDRLDFSPKDQVVRLPLDDPNREGEIELKKETSSKILSVNMYTDFNGFQEEAENGLLQLEVNKKIPIWTKRMNLGLGRSSNFGFVNYANFNLSWQKIGEEDKELVLTKSKRFENNLEVTDFYTTYLNLVRFENISVGVDLNIASFDFPLAKTRLELNAGAHYGRIEVVDEKTVISNNDQESSTRAFEETINMIRLYPDVMLWIRPEERFGGYLRYRPFRTIVPNNDYFFAVSSSKEFEENRNLEKSWLNRFELSTFFTPSKDSDNKFFFRYRYTNNSTWETNGYSEVQVGYLVYLKF